MHPTLQRTRRIVPWNYSMICSQNLPRGSLKSFYSWFIQDYFAICSRQMFLLSSHTSRLQALRKICRSDNLRVVVLTSKTQITHRPHNNYMRIELIPQVDKLRISYRRFTLCLHCCWIDTPNRGFWHVRRQKSNISALEAWNMARQNKSMFFSVVADELRNFWASKVHEFFGNLPLLPWTRNVSPYSL